MVDVKNVAVEGWLATLLKTKTGQPLENGTKQRIRNIFSSVLFTHAQRYEFVPQGHNPTLAIIARSFRMDRGWRPLAGR